MKIAVCTPYHSTVTADYAGSLAAMVQYSLTEANFMVDGHKVVPQIGFFMSQGSLLPRVRNQIAADAEQWGAEFQLWIDADHDFPPTSLLQLFSHNLPVVGVNCPTRHPPIRPTAISPSGALLWTTEETARAGKVEEVFQLGLALCLVRRDVIRTLRDGKTPLFSTAFWGDGVDDGGYGEDTFFFKRVREAGFPIHLDHRLSWQVLHLSQVWLSNADTLPSAGARQR